MGRHPVLIFFLSARKTNFGSTRHYRLNVLSIAHEIHPMARPCFCVRNDLNKRQSTSGCDGGI